MWMLHFTWFDEELFCVSIKNIYNSFIMYKEGNGVNGRAWCRAQSHLNLSTLHPLPLPPPPPPTHQAKKKKSLQCKPIFIHQSSSLNFHLRLSWRMETQFFNGKEPYLYPYITLFWKGRLKMLLTIPSQI